MYAPFNSSLVQTLKRGVIRRVIIHIGGKNVGWKGKKCSLGGREDSSPSWLVRPGQDALNMVEHTNCVIVKCFR